MSVVGRKMTLGYGKETTRNTAVASASKFLAWTELEIDPVIEFDDDQSAFGQIEGMLKREHIRQKVEGSLTSKLDVSLIGNWLHHLYGSSTSAQDGTTGAYTHTFQRVLNGSEHPTFTLFAKRGVEGQRKWRGCQVKSLEINITEGEATTMVEFNGLQETSESSITETLAKPVTPLLLKNLNVTYASAVSGLLAGTAVKVRNLNIKWDKNLQDDVASGTLYMNDYHTTNFSCEITMNLVTRTSAEIDAFLANAKIAWRFNIEAQNLSSLGSSILKPRLSVIVPPSSLELVHTVALDEVIMSEVKIKPEFSVSDNFLVLVGLQNTEVSY